MGPLNYGVPSEDLKWVVRSKDKNSEEEVEQVFDAVVVATGHYSNPRLPCIQGSFRPDVICSKKIQLMKKSLFS